METTDEDASQEDRDEFTSNVLQSMADIFWLPEIERRGGPEKVGPIWQALAILMPGQPNRVMFNEEAELLASATATRAIAEGEAVSEGDIDFSEISDLRPAQIHADSAWVAMVTLPSGRQIMAFDFRRNRGRGAELLDLADQYAELAQTAMDRGWAGPALENSMAVAELAVTAMMYLSDDEPFAGRRNAHSRRQHWLNQFTRLDNAPRSFHDALVELGRVRGRARYGERGEAIAPSMASDLVALARQILDHARDRVEPPTEGIEP